jgi:hypothetical protein
LCLFIQALFAPLYTGFVCNSGVLDGPLLAVIYLFWRKASFYD